MIKFVKQAASAVAQFAKEAFVKVVDGVKYVAGVVTGFTLIAAPVVAVTVKSAYHSAKEKVSTFLEERPALKAILTVMAVVFTYIFVLVGLAALITKCDPVYGDEDNMNELKAIEEEQFWAMKAADRAAQDRRDALSFKVYGTPGWV